MYAYQNNDIVIHHIATSNISNFLSTRRHFSNYSDMSRVIIHRKILVEDKFYLSGNFPTPGSVEELTRKERECY